jgi:uncharacterized membrane protein
MKQLISRCSILLLLVISYSCNYKIEKKMDVDVISVSSQLRQSVSYRMVRDEVFQSKCLSCHGNSGGVNLESFGSAYQNLDGIKKTALKNKTMPKAPISGLNRRQLEVLTAWIDAGGPEKPIGGGDGNPEPLPTQIEANYPSIKEHILDMKCISCHTPGKPGGSIPLVTKEDLLNSPLDLVVPGDPSESGIMIVLEPGARKFMPPVDSGMSPLNEDEKNAIRVWIQNGAH